MIQEFVKAWDANKTKLEECLRTHRQEEYEQYKDLVRLLFEVVINPYIEKTNHTPFNVELIHEIDDGAYQGDLLFIIPKNTYQPSPYDYVWTHQSYGSCSGCDLLLQIQWCDGPDAYELPSDKQVKEYMQLELHLLQRCRYIIDKKTYWDER